MSCRHKLRELDTVSRPYMKEQIFSMSCHPVSRYTYSQLSHSSVFAILWLTSILRIRAPAAHIEAVSANSKRSSPYYRTTLVNRAQDNYHFLGVLFNTEPMKSGNLYVANRGARGGGGGGGDIVIF